MHRRKAGLGSGLNAILGHNSFIDTTHLNQTDKRLSELDIEIIQQAHDQPRKHIDPVALQELADSIAKQGVIQPIVVRPISPERYEIVAGERRWRAAQLAGLSRIPVVIREVSDETATAIALIENIQREDLNPIEQAYGLQRLMNDFNLTQLQAGELVGKSRPAITNLLRLLKLDIQVQDMLTQGHLEMGHARALLALETELQQKVAKVISLKKLSVRQTERLVRTLQNKLNSDQVGEKSKHDPNLLALENQLSEKLGTKVQLHHKQTAGKGKLVIYYHTMDELDGILARID